MDNPEEILHFLEEFSKMKPKDIPCELEDYLCYVAKTGDPVFKWSITKCLFREKLLNVITDFYESTLTIDLPPCPNVDPFNYERMKTSLLEKLDTFHGAPFTVQRISELLTNPRKEYNRADKFMRAIEKNILVVSTREPGRYSESESESPQDTSFNGTAEPADSPMETTFTCNDLPSNPDSSSPSYEIVNSESEDSTYNSKADSDSVAQFGDKSESTPIIETVCEESGGSSDSEPSKGSSSSSDEATKEDVKECETVICSTVPAVQSDSSESENSNEETSSEVQQDNSKGESKVVMEESEDKKEDNIGPVINNVEESPSIEKDESTPEVEMKTESSSMQVSETVESQEESVSESISSMESENIVESSEESKVTEDTIEPEVSSVEETQTSNTVECDTSSSCDSDIEPKQELPDGNSLQENDNLQDKGSEIVTNTENEEAVTSCEYDPPEEKEVEEEVASNETCIREESVIHTTATSAEAEPPTTESMDADECQVSSAEDTEQ